jgi:hypothetical protein
MSRDNPNSDDIARLASMVGARPFCGSDIEAVHAQAVVDKSDERSNVVPLLIPETVNQSVVDVVEDALAKAKSGEATAIAVVMVLRGRETLTYVSKSNDYHMLNSGAAILAARLANSGGVAEPILPSED